MTRAPAQRFFCAWEGPLSRPGRTGLKPGQARIDAQGTARPAFRAAAWAERHAAQRDTLLRAIAHPTGPIMRRDFFPDREADMLAFGRNLADTLEAAPDHLGIPASFVAALREAVNAFGVLHAKALRPSTRTPLVTAKKRQARREMEHQCRMIARQLGGLIADNATRQALGLNIRRPRTRHVHPPRSAPMVVVEEVRGTSVRIRLRDAQRPHRRARPDEATVATLFCHVGDNPPLGRERWRFAAGTSQARLTLRFDPALPPGTSVWISAWWGNRRAEHGPSSQPVQAYLSKGVPLGDDGVRVGGWTHQPPPTPQAPAPDEALAPAA